MEKTVVIIHTSSVTVEVLNDLFADLAPGVVVRNIIDDNLLAEILANGGVTPPVTRRICQYAVEAEAAGADLIFNQCSSVGEVADIAATMVDIPLVKIDERMAETACRTGARIGVVATAPTTMGPTVRLIKRMAAKLGKEVTVSQELTRGALEKVMSGDRNAHNEMVIASIRKVAEQVDVVVCAQGSMFAVQPDLGETPVPVLMSPPLGVQHAVEVLAAWDKSG